MALIKVRFLDELAPDPCIRTGFFFCFAKYFNIYFSHL